MSSRLSVSASLFFMASVVSASPNMGLMVAMQVDRDGQALAKPSIWQPSGIAGEISMKNEFRLKVTPTLVDDKAEVKFEIFTTQNNVESPAGTPRVITKLGAQNSLAWTTANGQNYKLSVLVSETARPSR